MPGLAWRDSGSQEPSWIAGFEGNKSEIWAYLGMGTRKSGERHTFPFFQLFFSLSSLQLFGLPGVPWSWKDLVSPGS